ncbi:unnamed protein product [Arabis nemorensis]|uniref:Uncharacterized protein n=1 Tax=Arabis nemorensis TaxID=586526 RepID=A0A565BH47_9BRAS|nr:unnamed protein product [Arabis nemorensis]
MDCDKFQFIFSSENDMKLRRWKGKTTSEIREILLTKLTNPLHSILTIIRELRLVTLTHAYSGPLENLLIHTKTGKVRGEVSRSHTHVSTPRDSSGSRNLSPICSPRRSHSHQRNFLTSPPTNDGLSQSKRAKDLFVTTRFRRPELEREDLADVANNFHISGSQVVFQPQSCNPQVVQIQTDENPMLRSNDPLLQPLTENNTWRRSSIHDRFRFPKDGTSPHPVLSPPSKSRLYITLRLGESEEDIKEVSRSNVNNKRQVGRGGSTSRGRGKDRGKKPIPQSPLIRAGSKKRNVTKNQTAAEKNFVWTSKIRIQAEPPKMILSPQVYLLMRMLISLH